MPSGRPKGGKNKSYTFEFRLKVVQEFLSGESIHDLEKKYRVNNSVISTWGKKYREKGEDGLRNTRKTRNPFTKYINKKELTEIEKLEYEIAKKDHELLKKEIEILKLKKLRDLQQETTARKN